MGDAMTTILTLYNESGDPMQFGVPLDENSPLFFGCLIAAIGLVYLFCSQKFGERSVVENKDYVYQLTPRQLATPQEYSKGFLIYLSTMVSTVVILSLIGPKNLHSLGLPVAQDISYAIVSARGRVCPDQCLAKRPDAPGDRKASTAICA
jgi:hypothetical protein